MADLVCELARQVVEAGGCRLIACARSDNQPALVVCFIDDQNRNGLFTISDLELEMDGLTGVDALMRERFERARNDH